MRKITREQVHSDNKETKGKRQTDGKAAKRCKVKKTMQTDGQDRRTKTTK